jgi:hypothetical protein
MNDKKVERMQRRVARMIGLVRMLSGEYKPSNERSEEKMRDLFVQVCGPSGARFEPIVDHASLPMWRRLAKLHGYEIVTSNKAV